MAFSSVFLTCSWLTTSAKDCGRYFLAITWYMGWVSGCRADSYARPRVIRGTRTAPLPLLPSGPGGVCGRPLHEARDLTSIYRNMGPDFAFRPGDVHWTVANTTVRENVYCVEEGSEARGSKICEKSPMRSTAVGTEPRKPVATLDESLIDWMAPNLTPEAAASD